MSEEHEVAPGFRARQWQLANGMVLEFLDPHGRQGNEFLQRFLDHTGPGAHHLTFRVPDIHEAVASAQREGWQVLYVRADDPGWHEAFFHPREGLGTVLQLTAYPGQQKGIPFDSSSDSSAVSVEVINLAVADRARALRLFRHVLGGVVLDDDLLRWPNRAAIRLLDAPPSGVRSIEISAADVGGSEPIDIRPFGQTPVVSSSISGAR